MASGVTIDSGPIDATDQLRNVPRERWRSLMIARRCFMEIHLGYDCRCLIEFVNDATEMFAALGFDSPEAMIRDGYQLQPEEIAIAVEWLRLNPQEDPISLDGVSKAAAKMQALDAEDRANKQASRQGKRTDLVDNSEIDIHEVERPSGTSTAAFLRRLRDPDKGRPDIHKRVLSGEITAHAGMIEAGFRKKRERKKQTPFDRIARLLNQLLPELSNDDRDRLRRLIDTERGNDA